MLGDLLGEEAGQVTGRRVLPSEGSGTRIEVSFRANGQLLGNPHTTMATYITVLRPDGTLRAEGQGFVTTADGEAATWTGSGVGRLVGGQVPGQAGGGVEYRGAIYYQTASEKLARLNGIAVVFEFSADENDKTSAKFWEWK